MFKRIHQIKKLRDDRSNRRRLAVVFAAACGALNLGMLILVTLYLSDQL